MKKTISQSFLFSLTTSLVASALGAWILFGPASAATWGGVGAVIGYSLGTAFPLFALIYLGKKFRDKYPTGKSLIEVIRSRFGSQLFKLILFLSIFYMTIFLIAEVTAISILLKYISGTNLWITAFIVISAGGISSCSYKSLKDGTAITIKIKQGTNVQIISIKVL